MAHWTRSDWPEYAEKVGRMFEIAPGDVIVLTLRTFEDDSVDWYLIFWDSGGVRGVRLDDDSIAELGLSDTA